MSQRKPSRRVVVERSMEQDDVELSNLSLGRRGSQRASQNHHREHEEINYVQSQKLTVTDLPDEEEDALAGVVIRYILAVDRSKLPITLTNIKRHALVDKSSHYRSVMTKVKTKLSTIFGMTLVDVGCGKQILLNNQYNPGLIYSTNEKAECILLYFCLSHIFMSGGKCTDDDLYTFLNEAGIYREETPVHQYFGGILEQINKFTQQLYLQKSKVLNVDPIVEEFSWGQKALKEIKKKEILDFVGWIHNRPIQYWQEQYGQVIGVNSEDEED